MPAEDEKQNIENENNETSDELLNLKKELAEEIVDKLLEKDLNISSYLFKWSIADYLVNDDTFSDKVHDEVLMWNFWKEAWIITPELKKYREMISNAKTKDDLENLKTTIFNELWQNNQESNTWDTNTENSTTESWWTAPETATLTTSVTTWAGISSWSTEKAKVDSSSESFEIDHLNFSISPETKTIYENIRWKEKPDLEPFACALKVYNNVKWKIHNTKYLTVVDFTKKKWKKRFFVINMENNTVEHAVKVWHGKNTGGERAKQFSNRAWSNQSSLWWYLLPDTITKSPNKSWSWLRQITWLESSNSNAAQRWIAVHPWWENGSEWCFTLPKDISKNIMEKIKWWFLFAYAESKDYFAQSNYFKQNSDGSIMA